MSLRGPHAGCQVVHVVLECYRRLYKYSCNGSEWHPVKVEPLESSVADETVSYVSCVSGQLEANESPNPMLSYTCDTGRYSDVAVLADRICPDPSAPRADQ